MAATDRTSALIAAVRTALLANSTITGIVGAGGVYRRAKPGRAMPYLSIGETADDDAGTSDSDAQEIRFDVHCWSRLGRDAAQGETLKTAVMATLHHAALPLAGLVLLRCERGMGPMPDEDEDVAHMVVSCRAIVGHA